MKNNFRTIFDDYDYMNVKFMKSILLNHLRITFIYIRVRTMFIHIVLMNIHYPSEKEHKKIVTRKKICD